MALTLRQLQGRLLWNGVYIVICANPKHSPNPRLDKFPVKPWGFALKR